MVAGAVHAEQFLRKVIVHRYAGHVCAKRDESNKRFYQSRFKGSADNSAHRTIGFESSLMESILEYLITYPK